MSQIRKLPFKPILGISSKHLQMIIANNLPIGKAPLSQKWLVEMGDGDQLSCEISVPTHWQNHHKIVALIHGLGGSHTSRYMVRIAQQLYKRGIKVVRINLRGCGSGKGLSKLPYCAGNSHDILKVLQALKKDAPPSEIFVIGFSLGANIVLKLAGEQNTQKLVKTFIAVCPPFDLERSVLLIQQRKHYFYHLYYLKRILEQAKPWTKEKFRCIYEFDDKMTGPLWGFSGAQDYYKQCSCKYFLSQIKVTSHIISAEDDPFVSMDDLKDISLSNHVHLWTTDHGSHLGFLGYTPHAWKFQWLDHLLLSWIEEKS